ncbi:MAG: hypothetical protein IPJ20_02470 [Flammeovirgaceae bacterium]|nr:hypothetical protein [Flammeovirgaceae bacterium]
MKSAYNQQWVYNLAVIKEVKRWAKHHFITDDQLTLIDEAYKVPFYHPNVIIRLLLFVAALVALSGVTGLLTLMVVEAGQMVISILCVLYGIASFVVLERMFIAKNHYKSGVTEAILYHSCGFSVGGFAGLSDFDSTQLILLVCLLIFTFAAIRYLDLITTALAIASLAAIVFYNCFEAGGIFKQVIPFVFILIFSAIYFTTQKLQRQVKLNAWHYNLLIVETICLLLVYLSGNYLVVRELSVNLMDLSLEEGADIPFAYLFYFFTIIIPLSFLYFGIKRKDIVLLRVSLIVLAFSVFTFKYYYSLGHPEITLTVAGIILVGITILLMRYLKEMRAGFTRENLMASKWGTMNVEALLISQTMGGNQPGNITTDTGGGGDSGGGGASTSF